MGVRGVHRYMNKPLKYKVVISTTEDAQSTKVRQPFMGARVSVGVGGLAEMKEGSKKGGGNLKVETLGEQKAEV